MQGIRLSGLGMATALVVFALLASCVSEPDVTDYPMLVGSFAPDDRTAPLIADDGYIGDDEFFVRYRRGADIFYGSGHWSNRIHLMEFPEDAKDLRPYILPLEDISAERWHSLPDRAHKVRVLSVDLWQQFKRLLLDSLLIPYQGAGIVLHFNVDDYFIYYDEQGEYQSLVIDQKPADTPIGALMAFPDLVKLGMPLLEAFLDQHGITERRIAFNTGDTGNYSLPFLYVNLDLPIAVFVRQRPQPPRYIPSSGATPVVQTAGQVAGSHTLGLVFRPFSSIYRLLFIVSDTVAETALPDFTQTLGSKPVPPVADVPDMDAVEWERELDDLTGRPASRGTMEYLVDGEQFFTRLIDAVISAKSSIALRTYIFDNDDYAARIGELLKRRSREGIDVRVLLDGLGTIVSTIEEQETLPEGYAGPASVRNFLETDSEIDVRQTSNPWLTGDHVKTALIDERIAFTGGMNIAREYRYDWHDLMVELRGPIVGVLQHEFEKAWVHAGLLGDFGYFFKRFDKPEAGDLTIGFPVRALFTRADNPEIFHAQRAAIRRAQRRIYVENAYFTDDAMLFELSQARLRGVDVRVIIPLVTDRGPITRNNALAANALLKNGVRVYVYPGMSHIKAAVFDGWACLGSANWDRWSFKLNRELNIATSHPKAVADLEEKLFDPDFAGSVELIEPFPERWSDYLLEMVGDYIF